MKIQIVDDAPYNVKLLSSYCKKQGYDVVTAADGEEAIGVFSAESPDLILMDVMMPVMDGYEATTKIKSLTADRWVPIILVTSIDNEDDLLKGIKAGADDYLSTPINFKVLHEKMRVMHRISDMQSKLKENLSALKEYHDQAEEELGLAKNVMAKIIGMSQIDQDILQHWIMPTQHFSGDVIAAKIARSDKLYACLADVSGHGLQAALMVMPISQIFYTMAENGVSLASIAEELNWRVHQQMPVGRFVATTLVCIDPYSRTIEVWNGGTPSPVLIDQKGKILHRWVSKHLPLGILDKESFDVRTEIIQVEDEAQLFICSDGLLEAEGEDTQGFGEERMFQVLCNASPIERFTSLTDALRQHLGSQLAHDDISLLAIQYKPQKPYELIAQKAITKKISETKDVDAWTLSIKLGPKKLNSIDIVGLILKWSHLMDVRKSKSSDISTVLTELYTNSLDSGILQLDQNMRLEPNGVSRYLSERRYRLLNLDEGLIEIEMSRIKDGGKSLLEIHIKDSGKGFDHQMVMKNLQTKSRATSVRGIPLVKRLCKDIRYSGCGNEVLVYFELD